MSYILNIETATTVCSVSLSKDGQTIGFREINDGYTHAENLHVFIKELLAEHDLSPDALNAIAVSKGPGSYTGLRIGVSAAKGLAYGLNIPLISIDTLQVMSNHERIVKEPQVVYCPMIDARRMEVYTAVYNENLQALLPVEALIVDENSIQKLKDFPKIYFFGDGMSKCRDLIKSIIPQAEFIDDVMPSARFMSVLSFQKYQKSEFENVAYFEPFYLKDFLMLGK